MFRLRIRINRLSDDSETYNVILTDHETAADRDSRAAMQFHATSQDDALALIEKLSAAIRDHTIDDVVIVA